MCKLRLHILEGACGLLIPRAVLPGHVRLTGAFKLLHPGLVLLQLCNRVVDFKLYALPRGGFLFHPGIFHHLLPVLQGDEAFTGGVGHSLYGFIGGGFHVLRPQPLKLLLKLCHAVAGFLDVNLKARHLRVRLDAHALAVSEALHLLFQRRARFFSRGHFLAETSRRGCT